MGESVFRASDTQDPKPITSNAFEKSRPRKKARRSCSNCQRAHKTCGNERPCNQCVKRGIGLSCVDGNRKPPKYLLCDLERPAPSARVPQKQVNRIIAPTDDLGFAEFIDPTLLHAESPSSGLENQATMRLYWDDNGSVSPIGGSNKLQSPPSEQDLGPKTPEDMGMCGEGGLMADLFQPQISNEDGYDGHSHGGIHGRRPSYGISISSGWSDTFFPCEMDDEAGGVKKMARSAKYELALL